MTTPFMRAYCLNVIKICHRRGAHAMTAWQRRFHQERSGGERNCAGQVLADKEREASDGHDGMGCASDSCPSLSGVRQTHAAGQPEFAPAQGRESPAAELLGIPTGTITEDGLRESARGRSIS
jgi:malate synthase